MERLLSTLTFGVLLISAVSCDSAGRWKRNEGSSNINNALVIEPKGDEIERPIGQPYILTCRITVDPALVSDLKWLGPDNQTIREEPERKFIRHEQSRIQLVFREVRENDTGLYHCQASYASNNQLSKSVRLKSYLPITWVDAPEEQYATLGEENEMITCVVKASPAATLSWSKAGKQIATGMSDRYAVEQGGLRISEVRQEDEGTYSCSADVVSTGEYQVRQIRFMWDPDIRTIRLMDTCYMLRHGF
ncbi:unnamed protein product [Notodromas monacha]|uniref:Ig-like domain-containing protein n=1 Tax=Notodromas monacha TaxID=399045 RepID=A0A7R9BJG4_9CRUS|nr:unnamed protein product [Notodromas monacha]CAG0915246.1 unnamed protein product [Notodromas monacha]